jgi:LmbE family N-acetylglucosaminyl deacetylase
MNVLVIAPHPDDEAIGCGGTLRLHAERGDRVAVVFLTSGELGLRHLAREDAWRIREREAGRAAEVLGLASLCFLRLPDWHLGNDVDGVAARVREILRSEAPGLIYLPHPAEWHPDHKVCLRAVQQAADGLEIVPRLRAYEVWTPLQEFSRAEDITRTMRRKLEAIRCHASQLAGFRYDHAAVGLNRFRGALARCGRFAEVFAEL